VGEDDAVDARVWQRQLGFVNERCQIAGFLRPGDDALLRRHHGEYAGGFALEGSQIGRRVAEPQDELAVH